jgi:hypothetical protein
MIVSDQLLPWWGATIKLVDHGRGMTLSSPQEMQAWLEGFVAISDDTKRRYG